MSRRTQKRIPKRSQHRTPLALRARSFIPLRSWRLQLVGAAVGVIAAIASAQSFASAREAVATYVIQPGDTLLTIAANTGTSIERLVSLNGITNPDLIIAGQNLALVGAGAASGSATASAPASAAAAQMYTVKAGDTLWDISVRTGTTLDNLIALNSLAANADSLTVGQVLKVPAAGTTGTAAPKPAANTAAVQSAASKPAASLLQAKVASEAMRIGGPNVRVGVSAVNLVSGEKIGLNADKAFASASVMKLPILVELERQVATGQLSWTDSLRAEAGAMIAVSDNTAANQIADAIKARSVNDTMANLGLGSTRFLNSFADTRSSSNPGQNQTTPSNMTHLLTLIATDQVVSTQVSADIRALLARNVDRSKLARMLPSDARLAHKSGWYDGVANDVGIVSVDRVPARWVIAVFTDNIPDGETGNQIIAAISKAVYDAWAP